MGHHMIHIPLTTSFEVKKLWDEWNIRGAILLSLWLQILLIFVAPLRKSTRKTIIVVLIWLVYLLADLTAIFAIGHISNCQRNQVQPKASDQPKRKESSDLLAFWAPFLLLHLGGPDTITAFSLEDNELWLRHLLGLSFQASTVIYVFIHSLPNENLRIPTLLMFFAGIIKYGERTRALYLASLDKYRNSVLKNADPGPEYAMLMEQYGHKKKAQLPVSIYVAPKPDREDKDSKILPTVGNLNNLEVVHYAYYFFQIFKGLIVDLIFSFQEGDDYRSFFLMRSPNDALRMIEVELNFLYGTFYTKVDVVRSKLGYIFRFLAFGSVLATLGIFYFKTNKYEYRPVDIGITYTLLLGAIALDVIALVMLIFSDRTFTSIRNPNCPKYWRVAGLFSTFLSLKMPWWRQCKCLIGQHRVLATPLAFRRWSGSISSYNLIRYCMKGNSTNIHEFPSLFPINFENIFSFLRLNGVKGKNRNGVTLVDKCCESDGSLCTVIRKVASKFARPIEKKVCNLLEWVTHPMKDTVDAMLYVSLEPFTLDLWVFIFEELKRKSELVDSPAMAMMIYTARGEWALRYESVQDRSKILKYVSDVPYDESILLWHIATDLCYYTEKDRVDEESLTQLQFSKILSDYMLYLLVFQPTMMSAVAGIGKIRFHDTCAEAERFFKSRSLHANDPKKACEEILSVNTEVEPRMVKGDRSKSVLFEASMLAKYLKLMNDGWETLSRMWVEIVSYATSQCNPSTHAAQLSKGGELITLVWLLMAHFGLVEQVEVKESHARARLYFSGHDARPRLVIGK